MRRDLTPEMDTAVAEEVIRPIVLVKLDLPSAMITVHSGVGSFPWNGDVYLGVGNYGDLSEIKESNSIAPYGVTASLSGIPQEYIAETVGQHYQGRDAWVYKALLNEDHSLKNDPALSFKGFVDYADIEVGATATIQLTIQSRLADWNRSRIRRYTHEDQQLRYPGDMGLEFVAQMVEKPLVWGR